MTHRATVAKIEEKFRTELLLRIEEWQEMLKKGDLKGFESSLYRTLLMIYNYTCELLLSDTAEALKGQLSRQAKAEGARHVEERTVKFRVATGHEVTVASMYIKEASQGHQGTRHTLAKHWKIIGRASPVLYDKIGFYASVSPSYDIAQQALMKSGVVICKSSVRDITNRLAEYCFTHGEENLMLCSEESVAGKRVVISIDGGRTRTRSYTGKNNAAGNAKYNTNWREPKLFVIDILDEDGRPDRYELPIYGCRFSEHNVLHLLERYLRRLQIHKARHVQIVADGAPWIWNNIKPLLLKLGVAPENITETLDYYHACEYVHKLIEHMPSKIGIKKRKTLLEQFKSWLWKGASDQIVTQCNEIFKRPSDEVQRWINYLDKHKEKTQYTVYEDNKLMCGSGIIESGIRRIINLRFKNASTFWDENIVEKLYSLRAAALSKRWDILISNLAA